MIALGSDHAGFSLKEEIKKHLDETGVDYIDVGCYSPERFMQFLHKKLAIR